MKKILSMVLALSLCASLLITPSFAASIDTTGWSYGSGGQPLGYFPQGYEDGGSVALISNRLADISRDTLAEKALFGITMLVTGGNGSLFESLLQMIKDSSPHYNTGFQWDLAVRSLGDGYCSKSWLINSYIPFLNDKFYHKDSAIDYPLEFGYHPQGNSMYYYLGINAPKFEVRQDSNGFLRVYDAANGWWVVTTDGYFPFAYDLGTESSNMDGIKWVKYSEIKALNDAGKLTIVPTTNIALDSLASQYRYSAYGSHVSKIDSDYNIVISNDNHDSYVLCNLAGYPFAAPVNPKQQQASGEAEPRVTTELHEGDNVITNDDHSVTYGDININTGSVYLPDEMQQSIGAVTFNNDGDVYNVQTPEQKFQVLNNSLVFGNIDMSTTYNITFNVNKTVITYIGATDEYTKTYEAYYLLPDGRSSADLTKEDLEQLNLSMDVVPYVRSSDDTRLRSLYHFDGNTEDASYWNYATSFDWTAGASLTYLESNAFNGCLYLDELTHDFTITLPSSLGTGDFTVDFRYYQSVTVSPQNDSYISIGGQEVLRLNGSYFVFNGSNYSVPVGSWNHLAFIRENGTLKFYLNGVQQGSKALSNVLSSAIHFYFGSDQQTYKYLDELRVTNFAVWHGNFSPPTVPYDTNLALVLPTDTVPVADEYWDITCENNLLSQYNLDWWDGRSGSGALSPYQSGYSGSNSNLYYLTDTYTNSWKYVYRGSSYQRVNYPYWAYSNDFLTLVSGDTSCFVSDSRAFTGSSLMPTAFSAVLSFIDRYEDSIRSTTQYLPSGDYTLTMVAADGTTGSYTFNSRPTSFPYTSNRMLTYSSECIFNGYVFSVFWGTFLDTDHTSSSSDVNIFGISIIPTDDAGEFVYLALEEGTESTVSAEFVSAVVGIPEEDLNTPTLAVRSDIAINKKQIGGVRPSFAERGDVYAMVESGFITSLQQYTGYAWQSVDGRIWTGSRWIPYSVYNVITLSDMYDIADASGQSGYEYIYSQSGFWSWWQKQWLEFKQWYSSLSFTGGGGDTVVEGDTINNDYDVDIDFGTARSNSVGLLQFIQTIFGDITSGFANFTSLYTSPDDSLDVLFPTEQTDE